jgi:hypothetical protein
MFRAAVAAGPTSAVEHAVEDEKVVLVESA